MRMIFFDCFQFGGIGIGFWDISKVFMFGNLALTSLKFKARSLLPCRSTSFKSFSWIAISLTLNSANWLCFKSNNFSFGKWFKMLVLNASNWLHPKWISSSSWFISKIELSNDESLFELSSTTFNFEQFLNALGSISSNLDRGASLECSLEQQTDC